MVALGNFCALLLLHEAQKVLQTRLDSLSSALSFAPSAPLSQDKENQLTPKQSLISAMDSHPVALFLFITGEQTPRPWLPSCLPCPTPVCSAPVN